MEQVLEVQSRESLANSMAKIVKLQNTSIVSRFESLGKKKMNKLLEFILKKKSEKILRRSITRWRVRSDSKIIKQALHQILMNGPVSKVVVFHRLFHDSKRVKQNKNKTFFMLMKQTGENSQTVKQNVKDYFNQRDSTQLIALAKLHDNLSILGKNKQKQILDNIQFKINEAEFATKHLSLKNTFESINNSLKNQYGFFKQVRINKLLKSILRNKVRQYLKIWFVKANETMIPSNISSIDRPSTLQQQPSLFWMNLLQKPSQISFLSQQSKLKQTNNSNKFKSASPNQNSPSMIKKKMFIEQQPKRNFGGIMATNSYSYLSQKQSQFSTPKRKSAYSVQFKHLHLVIQSLIRMRLYYTFSALKQQTSSQTPASSRISIQCQQIQKAATRMLFTTLNKKFNNIQKDIFTQLFST